MPLACYRASAKLTAALGRRLLTNPGFMFRRELEATVTDCYARLLKPSISTEVLSSLREVAEKQAISVFATNLGELLLAPPASRKTILGIDPGFRTGCKVVVIDSTSKLVAHSTVYPTAPRNDVEGAERELLRLIDAHDVELIAIGNGTASRETAAFCARLERARPRVRKVVVNESGASIYSAGAMAREEFPDLDLTVRGAISIARRLQDPLAELVKIDPKSIGVGQYQHDVNQAQLKKALDRVVRSSVNRVGVDVNSASATLLSYVSGIGPTLARAIVTHREAAGPFATRHDLLQVPRFGAKAFEQSAGFLRVRDGAKALDATAVHPESYYIVETISRSIATDQSSDVKRAQSVFDLGRKIPSERPCPVSHRGGRSSGFRQLDDPVHYNDRPSPMSLTPGTSVGPYAIRAQIGTGGMGVVYAAHDPRLDRQVAIKVLSPDRIRDDAAKRRFVQEAKAASALDHPNICAIHEINETDDGQLYLVMAYYDGETLERRIERGPLALDEAVDIATQAACGLAEAHAARMVHRDIKPANLLVATDGVVKILDFGLAKLIGSEGVTQTGTTVGTVAYMSPEQARGRWVDHRTDIWSLGVVLYEMLTGQRPFQGENLLAVSKAILEDQPPPLRGPSAVYQHVVSRALRKDQIGRYDSTLDLAGGLREAKQPSHAPTQVGGDESAQRCIAVMPFANMSADPEQEYFCDGMAEELINALTKLDDLRVVARTSTFQFKGQALDLREVGRKLGATTVLEGSVRKSGNRLRVTAQLISVADGYHLWSERYDRQMEDVFAIQDDVSQAIVDVLRVKLLPASAPPVADRYTEDVHAYQLYLQGRHHWHKHTEDGYARSLDCFTRAIARDPSYAQPYVGLAHLYLWTGFLGSSPASEAYPKAKESALKALQLDETIGDAHSALGFVLTQYEWDWTGLARPVGVQTSDRACPSLDRHAPSVQRVSNESRTDRRSH